MIYFNLSVFFVDYFFFVYDDGFEYKNYYVGFVRLFFNELFSFVYIGDNFFVDVFKIFIYFFVLL